MLKRRRTVPYSLSKNDTGYEFGWDYNGKRSALKWAAAEAKRRRYPVAVRDRSGALIARFTTRGVQIVETDDGGSNAGTD